MKSTIGSDSVNEWISIEDRWPDEGGQYIVAWQNGEVSAIEIDDDGDMLDIDAAITHWMPLPEPPPHCKKKIQRI